MELTVRKLDSDYTGQDIVCIPRKFRGGIKVSTLCKISTPTSSKVLAVYGLTDENPVIEMDARTRSHFGLTTGDIAKFEVVPVKWLGAWQWAAKHADPAQRIAAQLGLLSLGLGVVSVILGIVSVVLAIKL